jgi:hypothetical protein
MMTVERIHKATGRLRAALTIVGLSLLALPAMAMAQSPTDSQYSSNLDFVTSGGGAPGGGGGGAEASAGAPGGLPFTGLDVGLLAVVAGGLLVAGLMLWRQRPKDSS